MQKDGGSCSIAWTYKQSIPAGDVKQLPGLTFLDVKSVTVDACKAACCEQGPSKCQYLWIVNKKCLAISCPEILNDQCLPSKLTSSASSLDSTYFKMTFDKGISIILAVFMHVCILV